MRLRKSAEKEFRDSGRYAISVYSLPDLDVKAILERGLTDNATLSEYSMIRVATAGQLRHAGYEVQLTDPACGHADLILPSQPTDEGHWVTLRAIMALQGNPIKGQ